MNTILLLALLSAFPSSGHLLPVGFTATIDSNAYASVLTLTETVTMPASPASTVFVTPGPTCTVYSDVCVTAKLQDDLRRIVHPHMALLKPSERTFFGDLAGGRSLGYTRFWKRGLGYSEGIRKLGWETEAMTDIEEDMTVPSTPTPTTLQSMSHGSGNGPSTGNSVFRSPWLVEFMIILGVIISITATGVVLGFRLLRDKPTNDSKDVPNADDNRATLNPYARAQFLAEARNEVFRVQYADIFKMESSESIGGTRSRLVSEFELGDREAASGSQPQLDGSVSRRGKAVVLVEK